MDETMPHGGDTPDRTIAPAATDLFIGLTPEKVLEAVERSGLSTRPVCYPLNSFENRVYEVELADGSRVVAKFYRPGRWSEEQILEEHRFLADLAGAEISVCEVRPFPAGHTIQTIEGIHYSLWDRRGGRAPDELDGDAVYRLGMFVGRMHTVGVSDVFAVRPRLDADRYVRRQMRFLEAEGLIPRPFEARYLRTAEAIADIADRLLDGVETQRIHADLHLGNILFRDGELRVLDFDDACIGPAVQDLWLALPGRDEDTARRRSLFIEGYERFRLFDRSTLRLVEVLRGLRLVRYCGWLARRRHDPAFQMGWPHFGTDDYWQTETADLEEQLDIIRRGETVIDASASVGTSSFGAAESDESELTNKDFFWDWEGD